MFKHNKLKSSSDNTEHRDRNSSSIDMHQHEHDKLISTVVDTVVIRQDICFIERFLWSRPLSAAALQWLPWRHDDRLHLHIKTIQNISTGAARPRPLIMPILPTRSKTDCSHFRLGPRTWFPWLEWPISSVWMFSYLKLYFRAGHHSHMLVGSSL